MDLDTLKTIFADFWKTVPLAVMGAAALVDIAAGVLDALQTHTFDARKLPGFLESKVIFGILPVIVLYASALVFAEPLRSAFTLAADGGAAAFIAAQAVSIQLHLKTKPSEEPVPDEINGA